MVIAWSFLSTIGILIASNLFKDLSVILKLSFLNLKSQGYYKYLFPDRTMGGLQFWFVIHRSVMILVCFFSIASFVLILAFKKWSWIDYSLKLNFSHSIFGIVSIGLVFFQVKFNNFLANFIY